MIPKPLNYLIIALLLIGIVSAVTGTVNTFTNGVSNEQLNLSSTDVTRYISFPLYYYVTNLTTQIETPNLKAISWYRLNHNTTYSNNLTVYDSYGSNNGILQGYVFNHAKDPFSLVTGTNPQTLIVTNDYSSTNSITAALGLNVTFNYGGNLSVLIKGGDASIMQLQLDDGTLLEQQSISANYANFTTKINASQHYRLMMSKGGAAYTYYEKAATFPITTTIGTVYCSYDSALSCSANTYNILNITVNNNSIAIPSYNPMNISTLNGKYGNGMLFNGTGDYLNLSKPILPKNYFTISMWVKPKTNSNSGLLSQYILGDSGRFVAQLVNNQPQIRIGGIVSSTTTTLNENTWYNLIFTKNISNFTNIYINGVFDSGILNNNNISENISILGAFNDANFYNGSMDSIAIWNRSLSSSEVQTVYNSGMYLNASVTDGLVAYYPFENYNATAVFDENNLAAGKYGEAGRFDGNSQYIESISSKFNESKSFSFSLWFYALSQVNAHRLIERGNNQDYSVSTTGAEIRWNLFDTATNLYSLDTIPINNNQWYFIAGSFNGTNASLYLNGILQQQKGLALPISTVSNKTTIGNYGGTKSYGWNGSIDDVTIYNTSLSAEQIKYLYTNQIDRYYPNLNYNLSSTTVYTDASFNNTKNISMDSQANTILQNGCTCSGCVISGTNCQMPINLFSVTNGFIYNRLLNASYGYGIDNCSNSFGIGSNATALNVSFFDYNNISTSVYYQSTTNYLTNSFSLNIPSLAPNNKTSFCIYPNWLNISQMTQFLYTDNIGNQYSYFLSSYFNNHTQLLNLFTNNGTTQIAFHLIDFNGNNLAGYKIQILQYSVGTGSYTTTEILQTDSQGSAIGNIILNNAYYNILVFNTNNILVETLTAIRISSVYSLLNPYTITVQGIESQFYDNLDNSLGVITSIYFNNLTNNFIYTWADPTGNMQSACLKVESKNYLGTTQLSYSCTQSTSGTIVYPLASIQNDTQYLGTATLLYGGNAFIVGYASFSLPNQNKLFTVDSTGGLFAGTLLLIIGILIALPNAVLGIIYFSLILIADVLIGLFNFTDIQATTGTVVGIGVMSSLILLGLVIIYIGGKQDR